MSQPSLDEALRQRYCPPLDEALFFALASDFNLDDDDQRRQLEQLLDGLKDEAVVEQDLELVQPIRDEDPHAAANNDGVRNPPSHRTADAHTAVEDSISSVTTRLSGLTTKSETDGNESHSNTDHQDLHSLPHGLESASPSDKEGWLQALFPTIEPVQITETVSRSHGDLQRAIDELLNLSFINDDIDQSYVPPPKPKGIEGFLTDNKKRKNKTRKSKMRQDKDNVYLSDGYTSSDSQPPSANIWQNASKDVDFIVSRTQMSVTYVKSFYHQNSLNLALTIKSLVVKEADAQASKIRSDDILQIQAAELKHHQDFVGLPENYIYGALLIANMLPSAAKDLIDAMLTQPQQLDTTRPGKLIGVAQYAPINLSDDDSPSSKRKPAPQPHAVPGDAELLASRAGVHSTSAQSAFEQAGAAYRRGKSDRLMGGAAAYYASVGHEARKKQKALQASAADAFVYQQSTSNSLDLHGVTVEHAVRIARSSVENWWESLGDMKYRVGGIGAGYKIIVGVGTHSIDGIGKIGPAVSRMLMREGWRVNIQRGEVIVEGRARK